MPREVIAFFHEAREKHDEMDGDDEDEGDCEDEVVAASKPPVVNPYASKPKEKQVAKVFFMTGGLYGRRDGTKEEG